VVNSFPGVEAAQRNDSPVRVIRLAWRYPTEGKPTFGLQPVYYYLSREQARLGYDVHVVTKGTSGPKEAKTPDGVTVHEVPDPFSLNAFRIVRRLGTETGNSIIHTHATCGVFLAALRESISVPMVSQVHGCSRSPHMPVTLRFGDAVLGFSRVASWYRYFRERALWSRADRILAVSGSVKSDLESTYGIEPGKVDVVFNGVDTSVFRPLSNVEVPPALSGVRDKKIILYVGHFGLRKGVAFLIRAMKMIRAEIPDAFLVCVGGVPKWLGRRQYWAYLQRTTEENGLEDSVLLLDKVPNQELPEYYSLASVFVLPSYYEAFAKVLIEAMACGKPVVVTRGGGPMEAIADGESGLLVDYGSPKQLAGAVIRILQDNNLSKGLARNARERVEKNFTWGSVAERVSRSYRQVCQDSRNP
jgi:starch synthase